MKNRIEVMEMQSAQAIQQQRDRLKEFIKNQLKEDTDWGIIPGTTKPSLYKPGAEKLAKLFNLGASIVDKSREISFEKKVGYYSYTIEITHLATGSVIAQCEGSANSLEKKYKHRELGDVLNTLQKMAQKRAYVGAIIQAVGASDFYTQDLEDTHIPHSERAPENRKIRKSEPFGKGFELSDEQKLPYRVPFGKYKGKGLHEIQANVLYDYCSWLLEQGEKDGRTREQLSDAVQEFLHEAEEYLKENQ